MLTTGRGYEKKRLEHCAPSSPLKHLLKSNRFVYLRASASSLAEFAEVAAATDEKLLFDALVFV